MYIDNFRYFSWFCSIIKFHVSESYCFVFMPCETYYQKRIIAIQDKINLIDWLDNNQHNICIVTRVFLLIFSFIWIVWKQIVLCMCMYASNKYLILLSIHLQFRQNVCRRNVLAAKWPVGEMTCRRNVLSVKWSVGEMYVGEMSIGGIS